MHHGDKTHFYRSALFKVLVKIVGGDRYHLTIKLGICLGIGCAVPPLQRLKVVFCHRGNLVLKHTDPVCEVRQALQKLLIHGIAFCAGRLDLHPFILIRQKVLQSMIAARFIHLQIPVDRQSKYHIPDSVQLLLCGSYGAVCFFCQKPLGRRQKILHSMVNGIQNIFAQVHHVHTALSSGKVLLPNKDPIPIEKYCELVIGIGVRNKDLFHLLFHVISSMLYPIKIWRFPNHSQFYCIKGRFVIPCRHKASVSEEPI